MKLIDVEGVEIGRAVVNYTAEQTRQLAGLRSDEAATVLGYHGPEEVSSTRCLSHPSDCLMLLAVSLQLVSRNNLALLSAIDA